MDPPFESADEFSALAQAVRDAMRKFCIRNCAGLDIRSNRRPRRMDLSARVLAGGMAKGDDHRHIGARAAGQAGPRRPFGDQSALRVCKRPCRRGPP